MLTGVILLACFSVIAVGLLILQAQPVGGSDPALAGPTSTPGPQPTHTVTYVQVTGFSQYEPAEAAARDWAADAQLVAASANWPQIITMDQIGAPAQWDYRFYSPGKQRLLFVTVKLDGQVRAIEHRPTVTLPPQPIGTDTWVIDSPAALAIWLDYGGYKLLQTNPGFELLVQLRQPHNSPGPVWVVVGFDDRTETMHTTVIEATEGVVIKSSPET